MLMTSLRINAKAALLLLGLAPCSVLAQESAPQAGQCNEDWTGTVNYYLTQSYSDASREERNSGRGSEVRHFQLDHQYQAAIKLAKPSTAESTSVAQASIAYRFNSVETVVASERNSCDNGKSWRNMTGTFTTKVNSQANAQTEAEVGVDIADDGSYALSVSLPEITGTLGGSESEQYSGQCDARESQQQQSSPNPIMVDAVSFATDYQQFINPAQPDNLTGSYSEQFEHQLNRLEWQLSRCNGKLRLLDLAFAHMAYPNWGEWRAIVQETGSIDGNLIRLRAKVANESRQSKTVTLRFFTTYKGDKYNSAMPDSQLNNNDIVISLAAGEQQEVDFIWDSTGYAWFDDGRPRRQQMFRIELHEAQRKVDEMSKSLTINPRPVVLVHGLWSNWQAWQQWQNYLTLAHSYGWRAYAVGQQPGKGLMNTGGEFMSSQASNSIFENSQQLGRYIQFAQQETNAWHVDLVAHSMGGLISRHYIHHFMPSDFVDGKPQVGHLIMLGTPNMGSPCAEVMDVAFNAIGRQVMAIHELTPAVVAEFNQQTTRRKNVPFSILAGDPYPVMCKQYINNDGVVPLPSALWQINDNEVVSAMHTDLTAKQYFSAFVKPRLALGPQIQQAVMHSPSAQQQAKQTWQSQTMTAQLHGGQPSHAVAGLNSSAVLNNSRQVATNEQNSTPIKHGVELSAGLASATSQSATNDSLNFVQLVELEADQSLDLKVDVAVVLNFGLTFIAANDVSLQLFAQDQRLLADNMAHQPAASQPFRSIFVEDALAAQTLTIHLKNEGSSSREIMLAGWQNAQ
jgi:pimeloyl-ACP methyl ester carboxylesterase